MVTVFVRRTLFDRVDAPLRSLVITCKEARLERSQTGIGVPLYFTKVSTVSTEGATHQHFTNFRPSGKARWPTFLSATRCGGEANFISVKRGDNTDVKESFKVLDGVNNVQQLYFFH